MKKLTLLPCKNLMQSATASQSCTPQSQQQQAAHAPGGVPQLSPAQHYQKVLHKINEAKQQRQQMLAVSRQILSPQSLEKGTTAAMIAGNSNSSTGKRQGTTTPSGRTIQNKSFVLNNQSNTPRSIPSSNSYKSHKNKENIPHKSGKQVRQNFSPITPLEENPQFREKALSFLQEAAGASKAAHAAQTPQTQHLYLTLGTQPATKSVTSNLKKAQLSHSSIVNAQKGRGDSGDGKTVVANSCVNCQDKRGKYYVLVEEEQRVYYCSRCSIQLAQQGIRVHCVSDGDQQDIRESLEAVKGKRAALKSDKKARGVVTPKAPFTNVGVSSLTQETNESIVSSLAEEGIHLQQRTELEQFSVRLTHLRQKCQLKNSQIRQKNIEIKQQYEKEIAQVESKRARILQLVEQETALQRARLQESCSQSANALRRHEEQTQLMLKDVDSTFADITQNLDKILLHIDKEPFQHILAQYAQKVSKYESFLARLSEEKVILLQSNLSSSSLTLKFEEEVQPLLSQLLGVSTVSSGVLAAKATDNESSVIIRNITQEGEESEEIMAFSKKTPPATHQAQELVLDHKGSIYISFENKEMFDTAVRHSLVEDEAQDVYACDSTLKQLVPRPGTGLAVSVKNLHSIAGNNAPVIAVAASNYDSEQTQQLKDELHQEFLQHKKTQSGESRTGTTSDALRQCELRQSQKYNDLLQKININQQNIYQNIRGQQSSSSQSSSQQSQQSTSSAENNLMGMRLENDLVGTQNKVQRQLFANSSDIRKNTVNVFVNTDSALNSSPHFRNGESGELFLLA